MVKYDTCSVCKNKKPTTTSEICRSCWKIKIRNESALQLYYKCVICGKEKTQNDSDRRYEKCLDCSLKNKRENSKKTDICVKCGNTKKYTYNTLCKSCALSGIKPSEETKKLWSTQRKGKIPPNKGKQGKSTPHTLESKTKISNAKTGLNLTPEEYEEYLSKQIEEGRREKLGKSSESKKWSFLVKQKFNFTCQKCGSNKNLHAHHIKSWRKFPDLRFDLDNGLCLCKECHIIEHNKK